MTDFSLNLFAYSLNPHLYGVNFAKIRSKRKILKRQNLNINEAIEATRKKQKECRRTFVKYLFLGVLFIVILPVGGGFAVGHFFENRLAPLFFIIIYIPFFLVTLMANRGREIIKTFSSVQLSARLIQILAMTRLPVSAVKNFAKSAFIRRMNSRRRSNQRNV